MKKPAFTMLEAVIVLGIVALVVGLTMPAMTRDRQAMAEEQFWRNLRHNWRQAQLRAELNQQSTQIKYNVVAQTVEFDWASGQKQVAIPATIKVFRFPKLKMAADGYIKAQTQVFYSELDQHYYLMKIQLAWGGYRIEKKDQASFSNG